jgi:hypothetical protein
MEGEGMGNSVAVAAAHSSEGGGEIGFVVLLFPQTRSMGSGAVVDGKTNVVKFFG